MSIFLLFRLQSCTVTFYLRLFISAMLMHYCVECGGELHRKQVIACYEYSCKVHRICDIGVYGLISILSFFFMYLFIYNMRKLRYSHSNIYVYSLLMFVNYQYELKVTFMLSCLITDSFLLSVTLFSSFYVGIYTLTIMYLLTADAICKLMQ